MVESQKVNRDRACGILRVKERILDFLNDVGDHWRVLSRGSDIISFTFCFVFLFGCARS